MSILLPHDDPRLGTKLLTQKQSKKSSGILSLLKNAFGWEAFIDESVINRTVLSGTPAGKIRLVTNRWIDKPGPTKKGR